MIDTDVRVDTDINVERNEIYRKKHTKFCVIQHQLWGKSVSQLLSTSWILIKSNEKDIISFIGTNQGFPLPSL